MFDKDKTILLHLSLVQGIGPSSILKILKKFLGEFFVKESIDKKDINLSLEKIYNFCANDFIQGFGIKPLAADLIVNGLKDKEILEKEISLIKKYKINLISFLDVDYPQDLKQIYMPPMILYCMGNKLSNDDKKIAVIGARKAKNYAQNVINNIVPQLVNNNFTIVSGGAIGVDSMAHKSAIEYGGKTVVVLGSGLMDVYPPENKSLFREVIKKHGTIISPFPLQFPAKKGNFPARNRIISGLSSGCLVVQAAKKSGALITAQFALDEGRHVFAIPGSIYDELSVGCHNLIKQGAKLVNSVDDILEDFGQIQKKEFVQKTIETKVKSKKTEKKASSKSVKKSKEPIFEFMQKPITIDNLSIKSGVDLEILQEKLFDLQLEGLVEQNISGCWQIKGGL